jgi:DNA-binding NarL/FixJ family response regulator
MTLRILIADDNRRLRDQLRPLLESRPGWQVVAEAGTGREAVEKARRLKPDVLIVDYSMPELDGISAIPLIHSAAPDTEIVILTVHDAQFTVGRAVEAGARGYVVKSEMFKHLMKAVEAASQHKTFIGLSEAQSEPLVPPPEGSPT